MIITNFRSDQYSLTYNRTPYCIYASCTLRVIARCSNLHQSKNLTCPLIGVVAFRFFYLRAPSAHLNFLLALDLRRARLWLFSLLEGFQLQNSKDYEGEYYLQIIEFFHIFPTKSFMVQNPSYYGRYPLSNSENTLRAC